MQPKSTANKSALIAGWLLIIGGLCGIWYGSTQQSFDIIDIITPLIGLWGYASVLVGSTIITCGFMWPKYKLWMLAPVLYAFLALAVFLLPRG